MTSRSSLEAGASEETESSDKLDTISEPEVEIEEALDGCGRSPVQAANKKDIATKEKTEIDFFICIPRLSYTAN